MTVFRILSLVMLLGNSALFSMENSKKSNRQNDINSVLVAVVKNDIESIKAYYRNGGNINTKGSISDDPYLQQVNPLMVAAFYGRPKALKELIQMGVELNHVNESGDTALHMTARTGRASLVRLLVKAGANPCIRNCNGLTARDEADNSLLRHFPLHNGRSKNCNFKRMINLLKRTEGYYTECFIQPINTINSEDYPVMLIPNYIMVLGDDGSPLFFFFEGNVLI